MLQWPACAGTPSDPSPPERQAVSHACLFQPYELLCCCQDRAALVLLDPLILVLLCSSKNLPEQRPLNRSLQSKVNHLVG